MRLLNPVLTRSGWVYVIAASIPFSHEVIAHPMYFPNDGGYRKFRNLPYLKYLSRKQSSRPWNQPYPHEKCINRWAVRMPISEIVEQIDVMSAFQGWLKETDPRQEILLKILHNANIPFNHIGLGGSFSLGCQTAESDLDILIYGTRHIAPCLKELGNTLLSGDAQLMSSEIANGYARRYGKLYNLPFNHLFLIFAYDLTKIYVGGRKISFIFTYNESEQNQIPQCLYRQSESSEVTLRARVLSTNLSWNFPRKYCLEAADGTRYYLWSYHWLHKAMISSGMTVEVTANRINKKNLILTRLHHSILPLHS